MDTERTPVLVAGGGLVGLSMSLFLSWQGVPSVLVERHHGISAHPRARGVNPRTMELLRLVGLEERVRATESAQALAGNAGVIAVESLAGRELGILRQAYHMDSGADYGRMSPAAWCLCHQDELEPILRERAAELGADIRFGTELRTFRQDRDGVVATVRDGRDGTERIIRSDYLVGADGAGSPVRQQLGIRLHGPGTLARFINIQFQADLRQPLGRRRFIICYTTAAGTGCALLPINNADRWLLHVLDRDGAGHLDEARCVELVRAAVGVADLPVRIDNVLPWESAGATAERLAEGRTFLVGDAAHVMPPSGAFGSNTGIQDAHNLAWKLAAVLAGQAGPGLLATYDLERRPVAAATVEQAVLRSKDRPRLLQEASPPLDPGIRPDPEVMFNYRYRSAAVIPDDPFPDDGAWEPVLGGRPGTRASHRILERDGERLSTIDLYGRAFTLAAGPQGEAWRAAAARVAGRAGVGLDAIQIGPASGGLVDVDGRWCEAHGITPTGALLVRPDGFVGWRARALQAHPERVLASLLDRLLSRDDRRQPARS